MPAIAAVRRICVSLLLLSTLNACRDAGQEAVATAPLSTAVRSAPESVAGRTSALPDFTPLVEAVGPAVVNVVTVRGQPGGRPDSAGGLPNDPLFEFFRRFAPDLPRPGGPQQRIQGLGSGFIISQDGLVLTNAHVVADARSVTIRLADTKREFPGKVLGVDRASDVALVKIDASGLPVARLGNSADIKPGQWVAAIGSPFGFSNTITAGIVSATNRELPDESMVPFIQTDVALNPGNSGGPLINMAGEVVGINSMIYSDTGGYMGVSFAIPVETAMDVAKQLQAKGKVTRGRLGIVIQPVTVELAQAFRLQTTDGVLVSTVEPGGPADRAGLKSGDVILEFEGTPITGSAELPRMVAKMQPGSTVRLSVWREGNRHEMAVKVGEAPTERLAEAPTLAPRAAANRFGLALSELPPAQREQLGIDYGLLVEGVEGPAASDSTLRPGDVIVAVNQTRFASVADFNQILSRQPPGEPVAFLVRRGDATMYITARVPGAKQ